MMRSIFFFLMVCLPLLTLAQVKVVEEHPNVEGLRYQKAIKKEKYNVAVITPLYLDSVDLASNLTHLPRPMQQGIDFLKGIEIAADTLNRLGVKLDIHVYDSKSDSLSVAQLLRSKLLDSTDLIIGNLSGNDLTLVAEFAKLRHVEFVSAGSPADAGQEANPYFTIIQPRLISHIEKIHRSIHYRYPDDNVIFIYRDVPAEKNALSYFRNDILNPLPAKFKMLSLSDDSIDMSRLWVGTEIDTNKKTTIVLGILDPTLSYKLLKQLLPYAKQRGMKVYAMPTAESLKTLGKTDEFPVMPIYYTAPHFIDKITPASLYISKEYRRLMGGYVTDIVYRGFESLYFFTGLMQKYGTPFYEHIGDNANTFITPYKIVPVKEKGTIKYYENKYLYILRYENGILTYE